MRGSPHIIIVRICQKNDSKESIKVECPLWGKRKRLQQNITGTLCENHTRRVGQSHLEMNKKKGPIEKMREKKLWQSTQHNYENGSSLTQEEVTKRSTH